MHPILVGSTAYAVLKPQDKRIKPNDIDLMHTSDYHCSFDYDSTYVSDELYNELIKHSILTKHKNLTVYLPSPEALAVIYLGASIRIRPQHDWNKGMQILAGLRSHLPKRYDDYGELEALYQMIVKLTIRNWGDAPSMTDIENKDFFKDQVPRFIKHDELHKRVAKTLRGDDAEEIFTELKSDTEKVELDKKKFDTMWESDSSRVLQMIMEELLVLWIERAVLVSKNVGMTASTFDHMKKFYNRFLLQHFITNLCGSATDGFLRRFLIHHYTDVTNFINEERLNMMYDVGGVISSSIEVPKPDHVPLELRTLLRYIKDHGGYETKITLEEVMKMRDPRLAAYTSIYLDDEILVTQTRFSDLTYVCFPCGTFFVLDDRGAIKSRGILSIKKINNVLKVVGYEYRTQRSVRVDLTADIYVYLSSGCEWYSKHHSTAKWKSKPAITVIGESSEIFNDFAKFLTEAEAERSVSYKFRDGGMYGSNFYYNGPLAEASRHIKDRLKGVDSNDPNYNRYASHVYHKVAALQETTYESPISSDSD